MARLSVWVLLGLALFTLSVHDLQVKAEAPTEYECRPYIEKALHELKAGETTSKEEAATEEPSSTESPIDVTSQEEEDNTAAEETSIEQDVPEPEQLTPSEEVQEALFDNSTEQPIEEGSEENAEEDEVTASEEAAAEEEEEEEEEDEEEVDEDAQAYEAATESQEQEAEDDEEEEEDEAAEEVEEDETASAEAEEADETNVDAASEEEAGDDTEDEPEDDEEATEDEEDEETEPASEEAAAAEDLSAETADQEGEDNGEEEEDDEDMTEDDGDDEEDEELTLSAEQEDEEAEIVDEVEPSAEADTEASQEVVDEASPEAEEEQTTASEEVAEEASVEEEAPAESVEKTISEEATVEEVVSAEEKPAEGVVAESAEEVVVEETVVEESAEEADVASELVEPKEEASEEVVEKVETTPEEAVPASEEAVKVAPEESAEESEPLPEEDLLLEYKIPSNLRDTSHIYELLHINDQSAEKEQALQKVADVILRDLKKIYDTAIKPLENLYKYRDLSNRHFGDPEIFSKPLILFMGPWSGGKSTILNYLTHNEYTPNSVRTGAEPSPAYFNILMHGDEPEVLDGTQLAADWTFSGLQKFGQGLLDRLRGHKLPNKLLERVNIVEIPGILEVRKQVSQYFPFNDACQWFIDRADIIFLVYDPSKLDVGPETEAILDQLKGREYQTRILLNKADQVKPEELLRVQGALIWNISPLMSSAQPPVMYTVSLWSNPYETGAPVRLLQAQERSLLLDLGQAIDKRIENKIASARRFAVRVRNHAKMVDCYLTTYYNHKTLFANKKQISEQIIGNPQQYHIYEGLSTLTNISRYDLPDPDVYRDFFHLNPLYEFQKLSETCTYFRGCPINKLDIAIAYDLPELVGKYKKMAEAALEKLQIPSPTTDFGRGKSSS
ncbi:sarcalumenin isoform X1 [Aedes aegypti]|uniref:Dynamin-type G domain-containing protein n=1 Tax=Aedes aegypti TaxID=7159 RepID=A0A6I8U8P8_AEDAE|nr:sarcalumenin isoform X1 [Aedes aegypti]XP_021693363.1 sarcalumenin isoform X1 [Aedes aegypti]XP_021693364.1 sarcalumenin isoform X1 [Aedes aegypti]XP_021693365.1 sarcalumenin isoform X1 [Aedes aegypti]XP_021693366.1 sarcalumenin isoform X1 [Aedes aegypti]